MPKWIAQVERGTELVLVLVFGYIIYKGVTGPGQEIDGMFFASLLAVIALIFIPMRHFYMGSRHKKKRRK